VLAPIGVVTLGLVSARSTVAEALEPLRADPARAAVLLDVDGTLAPIVHDPDAARVPDETRAVLEALATRYGLVACISGRRAAGARDIVAVDSITYVGNHGAELLPGGAAVAQLAPGIAGWAQRVRDFTARAFDGEIQRMGVRSEDKETIAAFHWRGAPDEEAAEAAVRDLAAAAEAEGLSTHWGRKVVEVRPPVEFDKGHAVAALVRSAGTRTALYAGDDRTDVDAFRALRRLAAAGVLDRAVCVGVCDVETPDEVQAEADVFVDGTTGVHALLEALAR
jgi:trehalose 6-phosphate phosphatase